MSVNKMFTTAYTKEIDEDERTVIAWGSQAIVDRSQEIIKGSAWDLKSFKQHPVIMLSHRYDQLWIGKALWVKTNKEGLLFKAQFAKTAAAAEAFQLVKDTGIAAFSVGFIPKKWKDFPEEKENSNNPRRIYTECELLEISLVGVPACPTALLAAYRDGKVKTKSLIDAAKDIEDFITETKEGDEVNQVVTGNPVIPNTTSVTTTDASFEDENISKEVILKPEENDKEIRLPAKGQEGKHKDHPIRWMTVSEEKGIKGLYCIKDKLIITYVFDKSKGWTMEKALAWMKTNGKEFTICQSCGAVFDYSNEPEVCMGAVKCPKCSSILDQEGNILAKKGVIPFKETAKAPEAEAWDGAKEVRQAEISDLKVMCTWFDSENPDTKGSYKLPHHKASGHAVVWRAVAAAMAALLGARGGVDLPEKDRKGVYNHLSKSYKQFDKEPPEFREHAEEELEYINAGIDGTAMEYLKFTNKNEDPELWNLEKKWADTVFAIREDKELLKEPKTEKLIQRLEILADEIKNLKEGRVLSGKNLKLVKDCAEQIAKVGELLGKLIVASEPPKEESILPLIEESKSKDNGNDINGLTKNDIPILVEEVLKGIKEGMVGQRKEIKEVFNNKLGKV